MNPEDASEEKVLILVSSLLAWDATPKNLQEIREPGTETPKVQSEHGDDDKGSQEGDDKDEEVISEGPKSTQEKVSDKDAKEEGEEDGEKKDEEEAEEELE